MWDQVVALIEAGQKQNQVFDAYINDITRPMAILGDEEVGENLLYN